MVLSPGAVSRVKPGLSPGRQMGSRMKLDFPDAFTPLMDERIRVNDLTKNIYGSVLQAGVSVSGGAQNARQIGDQYTVRIKKVDYPKQKKPVVHDKLTTVNHGVLRVKEVFSEDEMWSILATGSVRGDRG